VEFDLKTILIIICILIGVEMIYKMFFTRGEIKRFILAPIFLVGVIVLVIYIAFKLAGVLVNF